MSICLDQTDWNRNLTHNENNISVFGFVSSFHLKNPSTNHLFTLVASPFLMYLLFISYLCLTGHVKHVQAVVIAMTWQDVFYVMSIDLVVAFILHAFYLLASCALNFMQRRWWVVKIKRFVCNGWESWSLRWFYTDSLPAPSLPSS